MSSESRRRRVRARCAPSSQSRATGEVPKTTDFPCACSLHAHARTCRPAGGRCASGNRIDRNRSAFFTDPHGRTRYALSGTRRSAAGRWQQEGKAGRKSRSSCDPEALSHRISYRGVSCQSQLRQAAVPFRQSLTGFVARDGLHAPGGLMTSRRPFGSPGGSTEMGGGRSRRSRRRVGLTRAPAGQPGPASPGRLPGTGDLRETIAGFAVPREPPPGPPVNSKRSCRSPPRPTPRPRRNVPDTASCGPGRISASCP